MPASFPEAATRQTTGIPRTRDATMNRWRSGVSRRTSGRPCATRASALVDAPSAFGTTYDEALARPDDWWIRWAERCAADSTQAMFVAWEGDVAIGLAGAYGDEH